MLKKGGKFIMLKKSIIVLFSCLSINILSSAAAVPKVYAKRSSEYSAQFSRALTSIYRKL